VKLALLLSVLLGAAGLTGTAPSPASSRQVTVRLGEYFFRPKRVTIRAGTPIRFLNVGRIEHTVADSSRAGKIRARLIKPHPLRHGQAQTVVLRNPGTVYYLCTFHPQLMRGVIVVVP
jgi:plastocyanin